MKNAKLAIIIPFIKPNYLELALASISRQSCQDFALYLLDDASPADPSALFEQYRSDSWKYKRFTNNLGARSVVAAWNRCVLETSEEFIWLFSDDDEMDSDCVQAFYQTLESDEIKRDLYRFNVTIINEKSEIIKKYRNNPQFQSAEDLAMCRFRYGQGVFIQNYIFSRTAFNREGGFQEMPYGFLADDATWFRFARKSGVATIPGPRVLWRCSSIALNTPDPQYADGKFRACLRYIGILNKEVFPHNRSARRLALSQFIHWTVMAAREIGGVPHPLTSLRLSISILLHCPKEAPTLLFSLWRTWRSYVKISPARID